MRPLGPPIQAPSIRETFSLKGLWEPARQRINRGISPAVCQTINRGPGINSAAHYPNLALLRHALLTGLP